MAISAAMILQIRAIFFTMLILQYCYYEGLSTRASQGLQAWRTKDYWPKA